MIAALVVAIVLFHVLALHVAHAWGVIEGARRMAEQQERDASLYSAARRLDAEWDRDHGRPT